MPSLHITPEEETLLKAIVANALSYTLSPMDPLMRDKEELVRLNKDLVILTERIQDLEDRILYAGTEREALMKLKQNLGLDDEN